MDSFECRADKPWQRNYHESEGWRVWDVIHRGGEPDAYLMCRPADGKALRRAQALTTVDQEVLSLVQAARSVLDCADETEMPACVQDALLKLKHALSPHEV